MEILHVPFRLARSYRQSRSDGKRDKLTKKINSASGKLEQVSGVRNRKRSAAMDYNVAATV